MKKITLLFLVTFCINLYLGAQTFNSWRGPGRDGKYPETGLLKQWPEHGPKMLWAYEGLGKGFTSAIPYEGQVVVTGMEGETGFLYILSNQGKMLKKFPYGKEIASNYPGTRSTPAIAGNLAYIATGLGKLVCLDLATGQEKWSRELFSEFDGSNIQWGFTENLVIDGDIVYCTPGGKKNNMVALNRLTGRLIWTSEGVGELSAYCSPLLIDHHGRKILVTMMEKHIMALDAATGRLLWTHPHANQRNIHPNSPIYHDGSIYCFSGYGMGGTKLKLNAEGTRVTEEWFNSSLDNQMGGAVLVNGYIYGSGNRNRNWYCVDWKTGENRHESREIDIGTVIYADGMLYAYTQRGEIALIKPLPGSFEIAGIARVELGSDQHWAHPVINNGILYVRHGNAIMAYDIKNR